jgi:hypothetical protein
MSGKAQHVVPRGGKWTVLRTGAERASGIYATQKEAVAAARRIARTHGTELYIHGRDGRIRERDSFGAGPSNRKG